MKNMQIKFRKAEKQDINRCIQIRGLTNDNQFTKNELAKIGVTHAEWCPLIENAAITGFVASDIDTIIGFCFGESATGEILVLAILAGYENLGIGSELLTLVSKQLLALGHEELFLAASATPIVRSYGFYRHVGWQPTNTYDENGDEILTLGKQDSKW